MESHQTRVLGGFDCMAGSRYGILATIAFYIIHKIKMNKLGGGTARSNLNTQTSMKQCGIGNCCSITGGSAAEHAAGGDDERRDAHEGRE